MRDRTFVLILCLLAWSGAPAAVGAQAVVEAPGKRQPVQLRTPRIAPLPESQWTDVHRELVAKFAGGKADNAFATLLNLPELIVGVMPYTVYLSNDSSLTPRHRELLILRAAWLHGNQPLWATHAPRARQAGLSSAEVHRIAEGPGAKSWSAFEATLLRLADEAYGNSSVTDTTWKALAVEYDMVHLMDAAETVNHFTVLSLVYNSFGVQPDADAKDRLPTDVPYRLTLPPREPPLAAARVVAPPGSGIAVTRTFGLYPTLSQRWSPRQTFVNRVSKLTPRHREMLILRMGWNCRSEYEWSQHVGIVGRAREHGLEPLWIAQGADAAGWDPFERELLRVADELYRDGLVSDSTWKALGARFDPGLVMSAIFTPSAYRAISMSLNTYGVQHEPNDERFPNIPGR
jgi:alkylhydroperoxidase family enzyme